MKNMRRLATERKRRSEEKLVVFSSDFLFPARKLEASTRVESTGDRPPDPKDNQEDQVSSKAGRTCETAGAFKIHPRKTRITRTRAS